VVLVHLPAGVGATSAGVAARECALLRSAAAVVTTSAWTRDWLLAAYQLDGGRVHVAEPGVDEAALAPGTSTGGELVCVAAVARHKGQDVLIEALTRLVGLPWRCVCVGSTSRDPELTAQLVAVAESAGVSERFVLFGNRWGADLDAAYASADVLVLASRVETYGMAVSEALAHGLPVIASDVGGLPDAMGDDGAGNRPGLLVPPADVDALAGALRRWLVDQDLRSDLRRAAAARRLTLRPWSATAEAFSRTLEQL
jgi:glycosyltransferase involved in cell wall biosynthesis